MVDDSAVLRKILGGLLQEQCDFTEIVQASDGAEGLEAAKAADFDIIFLDWNMPKMQGIDVLKAIREMGKNTPIVMVTSEKDGSRVVEAFDAGADNYIIKPFGPVSVAEKVKQALRL